MSLLVDTSVWSLAFRRGASPDLPEVVALRTALTAGQQVCATGVIVLELLQGAVPGAARSAIQRAFTSIELLEPTFADYVEAAEVSNTCRRNGVQLGTIDALIAQLAIGRGHRLLTTDRDFQYAARHVPLSLWQAP